jgi:hypothetical protein
MNPVAAMTKKVRSTKSITVHPPVRGLRSEIPAAKSHATDSLTQGRASVNYGINEIGDPAIAFSRPDHLPTASGWSPAGRR